MRSPLALAKVTKRAKIYFIIKMIEISWSTWLAASITLLGESLMFKLGTQLSRGDGIFQAIERRSEQVSIMEDMDMDLNLACPCG